ncbi:hypothetical protein NE237_012614 [Protea cynaroides]|uniref:BZIP domain-containing protein n=1 Tax=Protea cynaroides TaxID=273540 RepID=A0A9Q0JXS5_9MAGN|nr:hypothetical protein NE237_012614 [Protea cynaroides]
MKIKVPKGGMSSVQPVISSASEGDPQYAVIDDRKRKRMLSNRESARRSRLKKKQYIDGLVNEVKHLQKENKEIEETAETVLQNYNRVESENQILRAQMAELNCKLEVYDCLFNITDDTGDLLVNSPQISDPLLNPWQHTYSSQPIMASANMGPTFF